MCKSIILIFMSVVFITGLYTGCSPTPIKVTDTVDLEAISTADSPKLTSQEAIAIAQKHSIKSPDNATEKGIGLVLQKSLISPDEALKDWKAVYKGNGKWDVSLSTYRWTVFESTLGAMFLGTN